MSQSDRSPLADALRRAERRAERETVPGLAPQDDSLTSFQALDLTLSQPVNVVILAGGQDAGKTTLTVTLYEQFCTGDVTGHLFAGCRTLRGYEIRAHLGRVESGRTAPDTKRTPMGAPRWLHLEVLTAGGDRQHLLFGDLAGEHFDRLISGDSEVASLPWLVRADRIAVVVDGARLKNNNDRLSEQQRCMRLLRVLLESEDVASSRIDLIITKWDRLVDGGTKAMHFAEVTVSKLLAVAHAAGVTVMPEVMRIASRSEHADVPAGHGVPDFLGACLVREAPGSFVEAAPLLSTDPFDLFRADG